MAFDLVHYFTEQMKGLKPALLEQHPHPERCAIIHELNCLSLGKLIRLWQQAPEALYAEISEQNPLYVQQLARQLTTHPDNHLNLSMQSLEQTLARILALQMAELKQLDITAHFGLTGVAELLMGQIEHLSGQAHDWVWQCNGLTELLGSKPTEPEAEISLTTTLKEFHQMVQQQDTSTAHAPVDHDLTSEQIYSPTWAKIAAPLLALAILAYLYDWYCVLSSV